MMAKRIDAGSAKRAASTLHEADDDEQAGEEQQDDGQAHGRNLSTRASRM